MQPTTSKDKEHQHTVTPSRNEGSALCQSRDSSLREGVTVKSLRMTMKLVQIEFDVSRPYSLALQARLEVANENNEIE